MRFFPGCLYLSHDYHGNGPWWQWTVENSHNFHLLAFSGDHVEATDTLSLPGQTKMVQAVVKLISNSSAWIALSGGNHDTDVGQAKWLRASEGKNYVGMGQNRVITLRNGAKVVVTSCPDNCIATESAEKEIRDLFQQGSESQGDFWLVLHHEPPDRGLTCAQAPGSRLLRSLLRQYHPDLVSTGHKHGAPWSKKGGSWTETIEQSVVVNAGQRPFRARPCHVTLTGDRLEHHAG